MTASRYHFYYFLFFFKKPSAAAVFALTEGDLSHTCARVLPLSTTSVLTKRGRAHEALRHSCCA